MSPSTSEPDLLYSSLTGDHDLRELVAFFVAALPDRLAAIDREIAAVNLGEVRWMAHRLKRAASSHGFDGIVPLAERLEVAAQRGASQDELRLAREELFVACRRATVAAPETATPTPRHRTVPASRAPASSPTH